MSKKICMISGKGGSGKTSLAFSFAKALVKLNLRVLLIDCDMSTHGATFFVKSNIDEYKSSKQKILSVDDILNSDSMPAYGFTNINTKKKEVTLNNLIEVENNFYFLPSDISITKNPKNIEYYYSTFVDFITKEIEEQYDIIIFDCQAGYSDFTRQIIIISDICLLVSEPDAVSAAANKALCFQMGIELENIKTFQIFNKITEEESRYYSKVATSAFFTNLQPILFNWKVRKVFALSQIPSIESIDLDFGKDVIHILSGIFPEYNKQLNEYLKTLFKDYKNAIEKKLDILSERQRSTNRIKLMKRLLSMLLMIGIVCALLFSVITLISSNKEDIDIVLNSSTMMASLLISLFAFLNLTDYKTNSNQILEEYDIEIENLKNMLIEYNID